MNLKLLNTSNIFIFLHCIIPVALISGPLISEILLIIIGIYGAKQIFTNNHSLIFIKKYVIFFLFFYSYILFSSIISDYPLSTSLDTLAYIRFILFVIGSFLIIKNKNSEKLLLTILIITFSTLFFDSVFQFIFKKNIFSFPIVEPGRISSFFTDELILGSYSVRFLPIILGLYFLKSKKINIDLSVIIIFTVFITLIMLSGERTALYFFLIQSILILLFIKNYKFEKVIFIVIVSIIISTSLFFEKSIGVRFIENTKKSFYQDGNFTIKNSDHFVIFNDFKLVYKNQNKYFGVGPKNFTKSCVKYKKMVQDNANCASHPHNTYLQIINEIGLIGLIFILTIFMFFLREMFLLNLKYRSSPYFNTQFCFIIAILTSLFPIAQTGDFFNNWLNVVYFFPIPFFLKYKLLIENDKQIFTF